MRRDGLNFWKMQNLYLTSTLLYGRIINRSDQLSCYAVVAQSVAHLIGSEEVTGSIPVASFIKKVDFTRKIEDLRKRKPPEKRWFFSVWSTFGQH